MHEQTKWLLKIITGVLAVSMIAVVILFIRGRGGGMVGDNENGTASDISVVLGERGTEDMWTAEEIAANQAQSHLDIYIDPDSGYLSLEEIGELTGEELAYYLEQVDWESDEDFLSYIAYNPQDTEEDPYVYAKLYLSMHGDYLVPVFGNPYAETEPDAGLTSAGEDVYTAVYVSTSVSYVYDGEGHTISLGWDGDTDGSGIYLCPVCSDTGSEEWNRYAFDIVQTANIQRADSYDADAHMPSFGSAEDSFNAGYYNFLIEDLACDHLCVSACDVNTGTWFLRWVDYLRAFDAVTETDTIYGRMIDLNTEYVVACFQAAVVYDGETDSYRLSGVKSNDAVSLGYCSEADRLAAISLARDYLTASGMVSVNLEEEIWDAVAEGAIIEVLPEGKGYAKQIYTLNSRILRLISI